MAKASKPTSRKRPKAEKAPEKVEEAVVIEETPAEEPAPEETAPDSAQEPTDSKPEPVDETPADTPKEPEAPAAPVVVEKRRGGLGVFAGLLLGGAAAAAIGFGAARYVVPEGWPFPGVEPEVDPMIAVVEAQGAEIGALADRVAALESDTTAADRIEALQGQIATATTRIDEVSAQLADIRARLDAVEKLAPEGSAAAEAAAAAYERELSALREMFAAELEAVRAEQADAATLEAEAAQAARAAAGRAALARVAAALDTGQPFAEALDELTAATGLTAPDALARMSGTGVPTLASLQETFPDAARAAIELAIAAAVEDGSMSRVTAFFRTQLGARSLEPREGDDADAVLSRAEAALKAGDVAGALAELDALPDAAAPAMADWIARAEARRAALEASAALAQQLNSM